MEKIIEALANNLILFKDHPIILCIFVFMFLALLYMMLGLKWPQILPRYNKSLVDKPDGDDIDGFGKLNSKSKKAIRKQSWKKALSDGIDEIVSYRIKILEEMYQKDSREREERQKKYDERFDTIEAKLESLFSIIADHEEFFGSLSQGTLENMLFNPKTPVFRALKAFLRLLAMDINGRVKKTGFKLILASETNKETWLDVLETMPKLKLKIVNKEHFDAVLEELNHKIYDGMMQ